jgi:hypothetical protein
MTTIIKSGTPREKEYIFDCKRKRDKKSEWAKR